MITHIHGKLVEKTPTYVVVDVNGVGYKIKISLQTFSAIDGELCKLYTHLSIHYLGFLRKVNAIYLEV